MNMGSHRRARPADRVTTAEICSGLASASRRQARRRVDRQFQTDCSRSALIAERQLLFKADFGGLPCGRQVHFGG